VIFVTKFARSTGNPADPAVFGLTHIHRQNTSRTLAFTNGCSCFAMSGSAKVREQTTPAGANSGCESNGGSLLKADNLVLAFSTKLFPPPPPPSKLARPGIMRQSLKAFPQVRGWRPDTAGTNIWELALHSAYGLAVRRRHRRRQTSFSFERKQFIHAAEQEMTQNPPGRDWRYGSGAQGVEAAIRSV